jgi:hypothetical protein
MRKGAVLSSANPNFQSLQIPPSKATRCHTCAQPRAQIGSLPDDHPTCNTQWLQDSSIHLLESTLPLTYHGVKKLHHAVSLSHRLSLLGCHRSCGCHSAVVVRHSAATAAHGCQSGMRLSQLHETAESSWAWARPPIIYQARPQAQAPCMHRHLEHCINGCHVPV